MPRRRNDLGTLVFPQHRAAGHHRGKQAFGNRKGIQYGLAPAPGAGIQHLAGGGDGGFTDPAPAQSIGKQVGHKQQLPGFCPQFRLLFLYRQQLKQGVNAHDLTAGGGVQVGGGQDSLRLLGHAVGAAVPVMHRIFQQVALFVQQTKVHAPSIEGDAVERPCFLNAQADIIHQVGKIPAEMPVLFAGVVFKAVYLFIGKATALVRAQNSPSAGRAKVKGQHPFHWITPFFSRILA